MGTCPGVTRNLPRVVCKKPVCGNHLYQTKKKTADSLHSANSHEDGHIEFFRISDVGILKLARSVRVRLHQTEKGQLDKVHAAICNVV